MSSPSDDEQLGLVLGLVFALVALVITLVIGAALQRRDTPALPALTALPGAAALPVVAAPVPAAPAPAEVPAPSAQAVSDAASITVEYGVVKFYFSSGKADLAPGAGAALVDVVRAAGTGKKVVIAGFHDPKGNAAANAALARQRALAVRDALKAAGVKDSQITLQKPEQVVGSGSDAEARRVEITLQ
ncbi:MAG: OmpA family protein [Polaromonas sp.]|uniref:OmpA family protein n=1 Tax=Polaromonas sp. TaxID=1869339 RepID=UPI002488A718|nr:OmpA family protein [Polaromonas sp.]MDI1269682.1 OmpA family protein [Polaromonas sp.]